MEFKAILAPWLVQVQPGQCKILSHKAWGEASYFPIHFYWTLTMRANRVISLTGSKINQAISCCTHLWRVSLTRLSEVGRPTLNASDSFQWQPATRRPKRKVLLFVLLPSHLAGECIYSVVPDAVFLQWYQNPDIMWAEDQQLPKNPDLKARLRHWGIQL